ncbi:hypothetical protein GCM10027614_48000 [Micromonospora vulcania]
MHHSTLPTGRRALLATVVAAAITVPIPAGQAAAAPTVDRQQQYAAAAAEYGVPTDVLLGVSYLESRWDSNAGTPSTGAGYGPMHLTDARQVTARSEGVHHDAGTEDPRGDDARPAPALAPRPAEDNAPPAAALQTVDAAAELTGATPEALRSDVGVNIRGGAALLASYQRELGAPVGAGTDPATWYGAVARYGGADTADAAAAFADEVYTTIGTGESRVTDDGQRITLPARAVQPERSWLDRLGLRRLARPDGLECPRTISCEWIPAPYAAFGDGDYGNHDLSDRPARQKIEYIVIHDTEASWATTLKLVQDPTYVSWHYSLRSVDGHVAQHVKTKDVAWHAGNWFVNAKSVGLEHEGFAARAPGTPRRCTGPRRSWSGTSRCGWASRWTDSTSSATTTCPGPSPRTYAGCTGTPARTGTGRTTSSCCTRRAGHRHPGHRAGPDRPGLRHQPAGVHRMRHRRCAVPAARLVSGDPA